ncbi:MAG: hypothetical protein ACT4QF_14365 [Sporichthyaceae bacterium]
MSTTTTMSALAAIAVALGGTAALLSMRLLWRIGTRPSRPRPHLTGRRASVYWYHPSGLADERGITARAAERAAVGRG